MTEIRLKILAADSMGVRSMATVVEVGGVKIAIDPGVSYAPRRYGLPPHPRELKRLEEKKNLIYQELLDTDIIVITHYHYDHYLYHDEEAEYYEGKILFIKDPRNNINVSQRIRAHRLLKKMGVENLAKELHILDNRSYEIDKGFHIIGSPPVPHGAEGSKLGYVDMVMIECCDERIVHASDVQGPISKQALKILEEWEPTLLFISGPPTYFAGFKVDEKIVQEGMLNLVTIARRVEVLIADHHFARDLQYPRYLEDLRSINTRAMSAAEFMGAPIELLEAQRKELWEKEPPDNSRASRESFLAMDKG